MSETKPDLTLSLQETPNSIEIQAADGTIVADLINEADCCVTESMRQYAALFSASPDMLAALKKIAADYGGCHCDHTDESCCEKIGEFCPHCISEIAIAKAGTQ